MQLNCSYFEKEACRSCPGLEPGVESWRLEQYQQLQNLLALDNRFWVAPAWSRSAFGQRTKAKFAVGGTSDTPILGRSLPDGEVVELSQCELHSPIIRAEIPTLIKIIRDYNLTPYQAKSRKGELKYIIVQEGMDQKLMLRFVLRSKEALDRVKKAMVEYPYAVSTVNIQPEHKAVLEGPEEIVLSEQKLLPIRIGSKDLFLGPKSFVQTNLEIASSLYITAAKWLSHESGRVLDLFCGIGGFAAHLESDQRKVVGVELSREAIEAARLAHPSIEFVAADAWEYVKTVAAFDIVVVNPPRRGLGKDICQRLKDLRPKKILYSSCNPQTLKQDLIDLGYQVERIQAFEMFPLTKHWEVLTLLTLPQA